MLVPSAVKVHGGVLEDLSSSHCLGNLLESRLNIKAPPEDTEAPRPPVADEPLKEFRPQGLPIKYKNGVAPSPVKQKWRPPKLPSPPSMDKDDIWLGEMPDAAGPLCEPVNFGDFQNVRTSSSITSRGRSRGRRARASAPRHPRQSRQSRQPCQPRQPRQPRGGSRSGGSRGGRTRAESRASRRTRGTRRSHSRGRSLHTPLSSNNSHVDLAGVFNDNDDAFLASVDMDTLSGTGDQNHAVLNDSDDDIFLQIDA